MKQCVVKSSGKREEIKFDKITQRIKRQCRDLDMSYVIPTEVTRRVAESVVDGITTSEIDELISQEAARMVTVHPDYSRLAARILVTRWQKSIPSSFCDNLGRLYDHVDPVTGRHAPLVSSELIELASNSKLSEHLERAIVHERDKDFDYFGLTTLARGYLKSIDGQPAETPQFMWMRVALGIHGDDLEATLQCYEGLSTGRYIHATPTLFNAGTPRPQMASCFLQSLADDSIDGIFSTYKQTAHISKWAGGIGLHLHNLRAKGSLIAGTGGESEGIVPMVRVLNEVARYVNQGGKRKGAFAVYSRALALGRGGVPGAQEEPRQGGAPSPRPVLRSLGCPTCFMQRVSRRMGSGL